MLGDETIDALLANPEQLNATLAYHVLGDGVSADAAVGLAGTQVETLADSQIAISSAEGNLLVNTATVTVTDIVADNGVVHILDAVLSPPTVSDFQNQTIAQVAQSDPRFSTLTAVLSQVRRLALCYRSTLSQGQLIQLPLFL